LELAFWRKIYTRKDLDLKKYAAYLEAEEELSETYVMHCPVSLCVSGSADIMDQDSTKARRISLTI
jgi:hypothetical protein